MTTSCAASRTASERRSRSRRSRAPSPAAECKQTLAAAPKPAIAATFSVPARAPRSWPPPRISGSPRLKARLAATIAPAPFGPPILCADTAIASAPSAETSQAVRPASWTASQKTRPSDAWTSAAASATGWMTPVSLLAPWSARSTRPGLRQAASSQSRSIRPSGRIGATSIAESENRPPQRTQGCSPAPTINRSSAASLGPTPKRTLRAVLAASVALETKVTDRAAAPQRPPTSARAFSTISRAARPSAWTEEGLPPASIAASTAARASGRSGEVALWSR